MHLGSFSLLRERLDTYVIYKHQHMSSQLANRPRSTAIAQRFLKPFEHLYWSSPFHSIEPFYKFISMQGTIHQTSPMGQKRPRPAHTFSARASSPSDENRTAADGAAATLHALKRLKVNDDHATSFDKDDEGIEEEEEEDERISLASASSVESTPPQPLTSRTTAHLSLDDLPLTPKLNNCTRKQPGIRSLLLPEQAIPQPGMNAYLGRLHRERRGQATSLLHGMDALCLEPSPSLFLPTLFSSSPLPQHRNQHRWRVKLQTDSKLE